MILINFKKNLFFRSSIKLVLFKNRTINRSMSLGNASVALNDVWAFHHNPAAIVGLKKVAFGVSYENRFLLRELQSQGFVVAFPIKRGVISLGGQTFGFTNFNTLR